MEKIINEFKIVETDDGFRIEIKGDKEAIRRMLKGFGPHSFFGGGFPLAGVLVLDLVPVFGAVSAIGEVLRKRPVKRPGMPRI